jgi:uncharacterized protein
MTSHKSSPDPGFTLLAKPSGAACNLACQYCFYLDKAALYPKSTLRMPEEVLDAYIRQHLASQPEGVVDIAWQGGEPTLMGLDFFQRSVELVDKYQKPGQQVAYSLQTNGTLIDDAWCSFLKQHNFLVGLSLDGTAEMHDAYRLNLAETGSFDKVRRGWELLQQHGVDTNILCAVHAANAGHALGTYRFFRDTLKAHFIQFIPIVERQGDKASLGKEAAGPENSPVSPRSVKAEQYGQFLSIIFDEWVRRDVGTLFIQNFEAALASWCHLPASVCVFQEICGRSLVLEHNGDLYSCDHFVAPDHRLGNILDKPLSELARSSQQCRFGLDKRQRLPAYCRTCEVLFACHGECPRNRFAQTPAGEDGLNYLCPSYKLFFRHVERPMCRMAELLRKGRPASDVMQGH